MFRKIKGQEKAISILENAINQKKIAQSYLFYGPDGIGKFMTAHYFSMALNCHSEKEGRPCGHCSSCHKILNFSHPDFLYIFPTPKLDISLDGEIKDSATLKEYKSFIESRKKNPWEKFAFTRKVQIRIPIIRMLQHKINMSPNESQYKLYIIEDADLMTIQAANAFLKTLEEPPENTVIILTTSKPDALLPTILSRCQKIAFHSLNKNIIEDELIKQRVQSKIEAKTIARIANGSLEKAFQLVEKNNFEVRELMKNFLQILIEQNDLSLVTFLTEIKNPKLKGLLQDIISHLQIYIGDIAFFKNYPTEIANIDMIDSFEIFYQKCFDADEEVINAISFLDDMSKKIERNVNSQLIFMEIYNKLTNIFKL